MGTGGSSRCDRGGRERQRKHYGRARLDILLVVSPGGTLVAFPGNTTKIFKTEPEESGGGDSSSDVSHFCERNIVGKASSQTRIDYTGCTMDGEGGFIFSQ